MAVKIYMRDLREITGKGSSTFQLVPLFKCFPQELQLRTGTRPHWTRGGPNDWFPVNKLRKDLG